MARGGKVDDEFYTTEETVRRVLTPYGRGERWDGARVLCPCDTEDSEYVKWFLGIRGEQIAAGREPLEVTYGGRWEDYKFEDFDFLATNPPFSQFRGFVAAVAASGTPFNILGPITAANAPGLWDGLGRGTVMAYDTRDFIRPDGSTRRISFSVIASEPWDGMLPRDGDVVRVDGDDGTGVPFYAASRFVPSRWDGVIGVPVTFPATRRDGFRVVGCVKPVIGGAQRFDKLLVECVPRGVAPRPAPRD